MFFGFDCNGAHNAIVTVIESPNCANVPGVPLKRAWTSRIGSTHPSPRLCGRALLNGLANANIATDAVWAQEKFFICRGDVSGLSAATSRARHSTPPGTPP